VAVSDPTNLSALDEFKFHTGINTEAVLVEEEQLSKAIEIAMDTMDTTMSDLMDADLDNLDIAAGDDDAPGGDVSESDIDDTPVVRFVNKVLVDAINRGASDIHLEPYEKEFRVRFRQDGVLHEIASPPRSLAMRIVARLKVMSRMNIAERRVPQDGRIKMNLSKNRSIDFRVNTLPTLYGEKVVLRILDGSAAKIGVDALGFEEDQKITFTEAINKPYGMVLVTGPTGSGKTVSLYTGLNMLNSPDRNISTCEDPVEINVVGINQVNVNPKAGLDFSLALRAFLRQDPDIIMVGEIRDLETAEIAVKAAQTGHLVLSTLHTNDAPQTLTRLANMGVPPYNIASAVHLIMAQRLARRLCNKCKKELDIPHEALVKSGFSEEQLKDITIYGPVGCDNCTGGYKGRAGKTGQAGRRRGPQGIRTEKGRGRYHQPGRSRSGHQGINHGRKGTQRTGSIHLDWHGQARYAHQGPDPRHQPLADQGRPAQAGHQAAQDQEAIHPVFQGGQEKDSAQGHCRVLPPAGHHDGCRRPPGAGLRDHRPRS
jgi:type IV pilus assembly protein PilB